MKLKDRRRITKLGYYNKEDELTKTSVTDNCFGCTDKGSNMCCKVVDVQEVIIGRLEKKLEYKTQALESHRKICKATVDRLVAENKELKKEHGVLFKVDMDLIGKLKTENKELKAKQFDREKALELLNIIDLNGCAKTCECHVCMASKELRKMLEVK